MFIAKQKRKENIAEYLLYMWQVEDIIRSMNCDIRLIDSNIVSQYPAQQQDEVHEWWDGLITMMQLENKKTEGHLQINIEGYWHDTVLQINNNILLMLTEVHLELLKSSKFPEYGAEFYRTLPFIVELRAKSGNKTGELETCFNALYGTLMLRLQGKEITPGTQAAIKQISHFLAMLAAFFKKNEEKPLFDDDDDDDGSNG